MDVKIYWIYHETLVKMRSCLWKIELGFRTNGWVCVTFRLNWPGMGYKTPDPYSEDNYVF